MLTWKLLFFSELTVLRLYQILKLRQDVFVLEQACLYADLDGLDQQALHILLISEEDDELLAYCRILPAGTSYAEVSIGRILVDVSARQQGFAKQLLNKAINFIWQEMQQPRIKISAQMHLQVFYESLGFEVTSDPYDEDGIEHIEMLLINESLL
ncbi:GNAT family N-acetyltransferase [Psychromonas sp. RZ22]|uniref:GNAT family N-acetyltransferase n=1 Tax=Psychromonas algarum TaxID=2555643 RepID=UPI001068D2C5|nr:GNAT family N-acetyltransferase [Psychromonas sp. RZ22]TEW55933.1 GNAT family N-acetyltransferase [Psychromonas sp. RZ22]